MRRRSSTPTREEARPVTAQPRIVVAVNHARIAKAEEAEIDPGLAIADALRAMASQIEQGINVIPYGNGEWKREVHSYQDANGPLGALKLYEVA